MKKILSIILVLILCFNSLPGIFAMADESSPAETTEQRDTGQEAEVQSDGEPVDKLTPRALLDHDVTKQISVVGNLRQSRTPIYVPVTGMPFNEAVAMIAIDSPEMKTGSVSLRLEPEYIAGTVEKDEIFVVSVWARVESGTGKMSPYVENTEHTVKVTMSDEELTTDWKHYYLIGKAVDNLDTVKVNIQVGYPGQITYFGGLELFAYSSENTQEEVSRHLLGDEYAGGAQEEAPLSLEELSAMSEKSMVLLNDDTDAYLGDGAAAMTNSTGFLSPFVMDSRLYIPLRYVAEYFGAEVIYNDADKSITLHRDGTYATAYVESDMWSLNGKRWRASHKLREDAGNMYIPCDILAELLGLFCSYNDTQKSCLLSSSEEEFVLLKDNNYTNLIYEQSVLIADEPYQLGIVHEKIENTVGIPALIETTDSIPSFKYMAEYDSQITYSITRNGESVAADKAVTAAAKKEAVIDLSPDIGTLSVGEYKLDLTIVSNGVTYYDVLYFFADNRSLRKADDGTLVYMGDDGKLVYVPDYKGNTMPDYSGVGYKNGKEPIPDAPAVIEVSPSGGDDTEAIQAALDYAASLPENNDGIRGAVQLTRGVFKVGGMLKINTSGVVLRGAGNDNPNVTDAIPTGPADAWAEAHKDTEGTIILLTTTELEAKMMDISGSSGAVKVVGTEQKITDMYVPTGEYTFRVEDASGFEVGDEIIVEQYGNLAWVHEIGMDQIPPRTTPDANAKNNPDSGVNQWTAQTWKFEREIAAIDGNKITLDMPVAGAIDRKWGGAIIYKYTDTGRISNVGVENMRIVAAWTPNENNVDETYHAGALTTFKNVKDSWVRNITTEHLFLNVIEIPSSSKRITIQDFYDLVAVKEYYQGVGYESTGRTFQETLIYVGRYGVYNGGQQILMNRVYGDNCRHLVEYMGLAAGPNVFYDGWHKDPFAQMGPHAQWSVAGLYDNTKGWLHIQNRLNMGSGHGWAGAWFTAWNTTEELAVQKPPTAQNFAVGHVGVVSAGSHPQFDQGYRDLQGTPSNIQSIFVAQTRERYGEEGLKVLDRKTDYDYTIHEVFDDVFVDSISVNSALIPGFDPEVFSYVYTLDFDAAEVPEISAECAKYDVQIEQAESIDDITTVRVIAEGYTQIYTIKFKKAINPHVKIRVSDEPQPENPAESVLDGNLNTRWSASGDGQWIDFEFNTPEEFSSVAIAYYSGSARTASFTLQISDDGINYTDIATHNTSGTTDDFEYYAAAGYKGKFIRIIGHGNSVNAWNSISEVRFYDAQGNDILAE